MDVATADGTFRTIPPDPDSRTAGMPDGALFKGAVLCQIELYGSGDLAPG